MFLHVFKFIYKKDIDFYVDSCYTIRWIFIAGGVAMQTYTEKWINIEELSEYLGVTKDTIRNWIKKTDIPAHKIGQKGTS